VDADAKWEAELEQVHGLTEEEACVVVSTVLWQSIISKMSSLKAGIDLSSLPKRDGS
jgi:hypothetical protein